VWETSALEQSAFGFVDDRGGDRRLEWGSTPIKTFMSACTSVLARTSTIDAREGHSYYFVACTYLFGVTSHAAGTGGRQA
jgi:hypothetical protein